MPLASCDIKARLKLGLFSMYNNGNDVIAGAISITTYLLNRTRLESRSQNYGNAMPRSICGIDVEKLTPGKYLMNDYGTGVVEVDIVETQRTKYGRDRALRIREMFRQGYSTEAIADAHRVTNKELFNIIAGRMYTRAIKAAERLDETGGPLNLFGSARGKSISARRAKTLRESGQGSGRCA